MCVSISKAIGRCGRRSFPAVAGGRKQGCYFPIGGPLEEALALTLKRNRQGSVRPEGIYRQN